MKNRKLYYWLIVLIYFSAHNFFNPLDMVDEKVSKFFFYALTTIGLIVALRLKNSSEIRYPHKAYRMLLGGILTSIVMATNFHNQSFNISVITTLPYLFAYLYFYILCKFKIPIDEIEQMLKILTICSIVMYLINLACLPNMIFGKTKEEYDMSRGFYRLQVPMIEVVVASFLLNIKNWIERRRRQDLYWIIATGLLIFLSVVRQVIAVSAILGLLMFLRNASWFRKIVISVSVLVLVQYVLPQIPMVKAMMEVTEQQALKNQEDDDIRIKAWNFYLHEYQTNSLSYIFGNGLPSIGNSSWGMQFQKTVSVEYGGNGCLFVDVGWAGYFWLFGGLSLFGLLSMMFNGFFDKRCQTIRYELYVISFFAITSLTSGPIIFYYQVCSLSLYLYIKYAKQNYCSNHPQLQ